MLILKKDNIEFTKNILNTELAMFIINVIGSNFFVKCDVASRYGSINCLEVLHFKNWYPWSTSTCNEASKNGHLELLKYLCKYNCPWNEWTCMYAANNGNLECLVFVYKNGCPCPDYIIKKYDLKK